jgi:antitoxin ParD1/3/4
MASASIQVSIPDSLAPYVEAQVESGAYGSPSDYIGELIREDRERRLATLEEQLLEALKGEPIELSDEEWEHGDIVALAEERLGRRG